MKRSLFMLGVAVAALASCTQNEVMEVAESNAIKFDAFVGKTTKAVTEVGNDNIKAFHVYGTKDGGSTADFFNGDQVYESETPDVWIYDNLKTWETDKTYTFAAYSNGGEKDAASTANVSWNGSSLIITGYDAWTEQKDLLVSIATNADALGSQNVPVQFTFKHALALIKFTIKSDLGDGNNAVNISAFTVTGINSTADLTYSSTGVAWANHETPQDLSSANFTTTSSEPGESDSFAVIPGGTGVNLGISFKAKIGADGTEKTLTATINSQTWTAGFRYNYVATITGADMDVITFADPSVTPWEDEASTDFNPEP